MGRRWTERTGMLWPLAMIAGAGGCSSDGPAPPPSPVAIELRVAPVATTVGVFGRQLTDATARDASGNILPGRVVTWASSDPAIASVSLDGVIAGRAVGTATITATIVEPAGPLTGSVTVTVEPYLALSSVSAGGNHTCGLTFEGKAYCWGSNSFGQLGDLSVERRDRPVPVSGGLTFLRISAGFSHTCGIASGGAAFCWGRNAFGALGDGDAAEFPPSRNTPTPVAGGLTFATISAGWQHSCGVAPGGLAYCWGYDFDGQLGDGAGGGNRNAPAAVAGGLRFTSVSAGGSHSCGVTIAGGGACWGNGAVGELGAGATTFAHAPVAVEASLTFISIDAGNRHTCARAVTGAFCWGDNVNGAVGDGSRDQRRTPTPVTGSPQFIELSLREQHACGVPTDGVVRCWGVNSYGQLGNGSFGLSSVPVSVRGGRSFFAVSSGRAHTCALGGIGSIVHCWGRAIDGALGHGVLTAVEATEPVRVVSP